ncbi:MAG TPA: NAD(+) synthase [Steroidobacteraceae bacterium]|nr:NAD(+) synthase [Steroidobacteraceae bacterium]
MNSDSFSARVLELDAAAEIERIAIRLREITRGMRKRGLIVAISGGIDSSVCAALAVRAIGAQRVFTLILPERDSSGDSARRAQLLAAQFGLQPLTVDIAPMLEAAGCYRWRDEAMHRVIPGYGPGWRSKIAIRGALQGQINHFHLVAQSPAGEMHDVRMPLPEYLQIVAATSFKQRTRKMIEYFHADRLNYAVIGTPNRLEYDQGFFVKTGDGAADIKPIAHLYKTQVYALARELQLPAEITSARPTTDTYSLAQGQDEFYFALPYEQMDLALWARNHGVSPEALGEVLKITPDHARRIYEDIEAKRRATHYLHQAPVLIDDVAEIQR